MTGRGRSREALRKGGCGDKRGDKRQGEGVKKVKERQYRKDGGCMKKIRIKK